MEHLGFEVNLLEVSGKLLLEVRTTGEVLHGDYRRFRREATLFELHVFWGTRQRINYNKSVGQFRAQLSQFSYTTNICQCQGLILL